jgi:polyisoprenyl-phosphate glycosyltransferase
MHDRLLKRPLISIVAPLYNEAAALPHLLARLDALLASTNLAVEVLLVDDGSVDETGDLIRQKALADARYQAVLLSRNFGHQIAVSAGMNHALGEEALFIIDGDLQDPPELLGAFYEKLQLGYDVVYGVRRARKEGFAKTSAYAIFYRILQQLAHIDIPLDSGDFCMISRRVADVMVGMPEESRFLRGMRAWVGYRQCGIEYERDERVAGSPKYTLAALFKLAYNGIFNFSELPVRAISFLGATTTGLGFLYLFYTVVRHYALGDVPVGFTAQILLIVLFGGINLLCIGILGEYVLRSFFQLKNRPLFLVREHVSTHSSAAPSAPSANRNL